MLEMNYYGAFIPSIAVGKNFSFVHNYSNIKKKNSQRKFLLKTEKIINMKTNYESDKNSVYFEILNKEYNIEDKKWKKKIQSLSPSYRKLMSILIFSSFVLSGWFLTPSKSKIVALGISSLTGIASLTLIKKFNIKDSTEIKRKILKSIENEIAQPLDISTVSKDFNYEKFNTIMKENDLNIDDLKYELFQVYKKFLEVLLMNSNIDFEQIKELINIKNLLGLSAEDVGNCHHEVGQELNNRYTVMRERENSKEIEYTIDKFFYLSDRIFDLDLPKGYQYESTRLKTIFPYFYEKNIKKDCEEISIKLYKKYIEEIVNNQIVRRDEMSFMLKILGISEELKCKVHDEYYKQKIEEILSKEKKVTENGKNIVEKIKTVLEISEKNSQKYFVEKTGPLFSSEVVFLLEKIENENDDKKLLEISQKLDSIAENYFLSKDFAREYFFSATQKVMYQTLENILKYNKNKKTSESLGEIKKILNLKKFFDNISKIVFVDSSVNVKNNQSNILLNAKSNFKLEDLRKVYIIYIDECLKDLEISSEDQENLLNLENILGLSPFETKDIFNKSVSPILYEKIKNTFQTRNFDNKNKQEIEQLEFTLKIDKKIVSEIKSNLYKEVLKTIMLKDTIPTQEEKGDLENFRKFLSLNWNDVQEFHDLFSEKKYQKSMLEAMGATGIISKNYWQGLEKLREKLQLSEKKAKEVFFNSIKDKLKIGFEKAIAENKKKQQLKNSETTDLGEDPTIVKGAGTALGIEAGNPAGNQLLNLIDLYSRNKIFIENEQVFNEIAQILLKGQNGRTETKNWAKSKIQYTYPVTLEGVFDKKIITEMYRDYLVECFSVKSQSEKRKLFNNLNQLGPILGLNTDEIEDIHSNVGSLVYKQYLSQALKKGFLDKSDMAFLSNIQTTLSMNSGKCSNFIRESKKNKVALLVESIFVTPKINPSRITEMRKTAKQLGIDLIKDLDVSNEQRSKMFRIEIDHEIEKGTINVQNQELINELQISFGIGDDLAKKILLECISNRCENYLLNAVASLRKGYSNDSVEEMEKMLNFGKLLPVYVKSQVASKKERNDLYALYQTDGGDSLDNTEFESNLSLLKTMLGVE